jgi:putative proteasome-type protease
MRAMTYCVGILLDGGLVLASDSRTHAGVDNTAVFCKMTVFERPGDRVIVLLSSGNLAGTQAAVSTLKQRTELAGATGPSIWNARTMFDVATLVSDAVRDIESRDAPYLATGAAPFNASFIIGGQIRGDTPRLFRTFAEGNFIEAGTDTPYIQTGESKFGKPIIDRVVTPETSLGEAMKCLLISFDSTMRSNLSVGMPIDLVCIYRNEYRIGARRRFVTGDSYFEQLSQDWRQGIREVFARLPEVPIESRKDDLPHPPGQAEYKRDR